MKNKTLKKLCSAVIASCLLLSLSGCGNKENTGNGDSQDGGSQALASAVEIAGAAAALAIAMPLLKAVIELLLRYF